MEMALNASLEGAPILWRTSKARAPFNNHIQASQEPNRVANKFLGMFSIMLACIDLLGFCTWWRMPRRYNLSPGSEILRAYFKGVSWSSLEASTTTTRTRGSYSWLAKLLPESVLRVDSWISMMKLLMDAVVSRRKLRALMNVIVWSVSLMPALYQITGDWGETAEPGRPATLPTPLLI